MGRIRVLIVDDSVFFRKFMAEKISESMLMEVAGSAINALEARRLILQLNPDVVTLDVEMPGMSGIEFLKTTMSRFPIPVVLVSSVSLNVFDALAAGAVDFVKKPENSPEAIAKFGAELVNKIRIAKNAHLRLQPQSNAPDQDRAASPPTGNPVRFSSPPPSGAPMFTPFAKQVIIALGASTGGTEATLVVMKDLPANTPGMVIVQHMPPGFTKMYADRLNGLCRMQVREAKDGDRIEQGLALIAPGDMQMEVVAQGPYYSVKCYPGQKVSGHCPSVDVLFRSTAKAAGKNAVGIIMTGMGRDGADGLLEMRQKGAFTIGQDEESCVVYGMPMVANEIGAVEKQASCENIPLILKAYLNKL